MCLKNIHICPGTGRICRTARAMLQSSTAGTASKPSRAADTYTGPNALLASSSPPNTIASNKVYNQLSGKALWKPKVHTTHIRPRGLCGVWNRQIGSSWIESSTYYERWNVVLINGTTLAFEKWNEYPQPPWPMCSSKNWNPTTPHSAAWMLNWRLCDIHDKAGIRCLTWGQTSGAVQTLYLYVWSCIPPRWSAKGSW